MPRRPRLEGRRRCEGKERHMTWESMGREVRRVAVGTLRDNRGQDTTEYAILVGVLVVIAIVAILAFRERVSQLWSAIANGINSL